MDRFAAVTRVSSIAALFSLLSFTVFAADIRPGLWETTATVQLPGQQMAPTKNTSCMRAEDLKDPNKMMPAGAVCQLMSSNTSGNRVTWAVQCGSEMKGTGELTFQSDSYQGTFRTDGGPVTMTMNYSGRRVGDCR